MQSGHLGNASSSDPIRSWTDLHVAPTLPAVEGQVEPVDGVTSCEERSGESESGGACDSDITLRADVEARSATNETDRGYVKLDIFVCHFRSCHAGAPRVFQANNNRRGMALVFHFNSDRISFFFNSLKDEVAVPLDDVENFETRPDKTLEIRFRQGFHKYFYKHNGSIAYVNVGTPIQNDPTGGEFLGCKGLILFLCNWTPNADIAKLQKAIHQVLADRQPDVTRKVEPESEVEVSHIYVVCVFALAKYAVRIRSDHTLCEFRLYVQEKFSERWSSMRYRENETGDMIDLDDDEAWSLAMQQPPQRNLRRLEVHFV